MVKKAGNSYQEKYISNNQKYGKRGRFRRTLGALLLSVAGFGILTGCPPPFNPIPPKTTTTEQTTTPTTTTSDPTSPNIVVNPISFSANEGDPVSYSVQASGGSGALTYSSTNLPSELSMSSSGVITGKAHSITQDETDPFTVTVTDSKGNSSSQNATFTDYNKPDFSGTIQSIETSDNQNGFIAVYDQNYNPIPESKVEGATDQTSDGAALVPTTSEGFSLRVDETSKDGLTGILLQGGIGNKIALTIDNKTAVDGSYIATFGFGTADQSKIVLMISPFPSIPGVTPKDFANFVYYTNLKDNAPISGIIKWNFSNPSISPMFKGIEIASQNPGGSTYGTFTSSEQDNIAQEVYDRNSPYYIGGVIKNFINLGNWKSYIIKDQQGISPSHINDPGWIVVEPNNILYASYGIDGRTNRNASSDGYMVSALIEIDTSGGITYSTPAHEFLRAFNVREPPISGSAVTTQNPLGYIYPVMINGKVVTGNYSSIITPEQSLIQNPIGTTAAQLADNYLGDIINNLDYPTLKKSSEILGLQFGKNSLPYN
ncbi:MAG: Ig domain-containing protein [Candidatus Pacearchaeota archaeon]|nr:Ig domain-containing protein [Candidatus Pacearchaeota archaeon]